MSIRPTLLGVAAATVVAGTLSSHATAANPSDVQRFLSPGLGNMSLVNCDLSGASLAAQLQGKTFPNGGINYGGCNFSNADLANWTIWGPRLGGANFRNARLVRASLKNVQATDTDFTGAKLQEATIMGQLYRTKFNNAALERTTIRGQLTNVDFTGADLDFANFEGVDLSTSTLANNSMQSTNFRKAIYPGGRYCSQFSPLGTCGTGPDVTLRDERKSFNANMAVGSSFQRGTVASDGNELTCTLGFERDVPTQPGATMTVKKVITFDLRTVYTDGFDLYGSRAEHDQYRAMPNNANRVYFSKTKTVSVNPRTAAARAWLTSSLAQLGARCRGIDAMVAQASQGGPG